MRVIIRSVGEFPGGPLVRIQHFHHRGMGSVPGLHQALCAVGNKKKKKKVCPGLDSPEMDRKQRFKCQWFIWLVTSKRKRKGRCEGRIRQQYRCVRNR